MASMVLDREALPKKVTSYFKTKQVNWDDEGDGTVVLSSVVPVDKEYQLALIEELCGKYPKLSSYEFMRDKQLEKELEDKW